MLTCGAGPRPAGRFPTGFLLRPVILLVSFLSYTAAQTPNTGAIRGQVLDQSAAAISRATVEAVNLDTGFTRHTLTALPGHYTLADLPLTGRSSPRPSPPVLPPRA